LHDGGPLLTFNLVDDLDAIADRGMATVPPHR
jgi:hypothetical protein